MAKSDLSISGDYAPVADRIRLFYETHPTGRIITRLHGEHDGVLTFVAEVYRTNEDGAPAATGWAREREGDGDVNAVACLENTETSAIGRALANLGFTASTNRPSLEEMHKAARARARAPRQVAEPSRRSPHDEIVRDLLRLIERAERAGVRAARAERWRGRLRTERCATDALLRSEVRLRAWLAGRA